MQFDTKFLAIFNHLSNLVGRFGVRNGIQTCIEISDRHGRGGMVHRRKYKIRAANFHVRFSQHVESLRGSDLMDDMEVDIKHRGCVVRFRNDHVIAPNLLKK